MTATTMNLSQVQTAAVNWDHGPVLVLAGPGSGKTTIIACRIARILAETAEKPFGILGLTFTNKAAAEMRKRVGQMVADPQNRINITTFHSFCISLLRQHGSHIGIRPDFTVLSHESERRTVLNDAIKTVCGEYANGPYSDEQVAVSVLSLADRSVPVDGVLDMPDADMDMRYAQHVGAVYRRYRHLMLEYNELDFGGVLAETLKLLQTTTIGRLVGQIYPHVCVDEFQDTTEVQYDILCHMLEGSPNNLFAVADDDQVVYGWNGADPKRLEQMQSDFDAKVLSLPESFRCPPHIIDAANRLISNNPRHPDRGTLVCGGSAHQHGPIRHMIFAEFQDEIDWVADDIIKTVTDTVGSCAVIARRHAVLEQAVGALKARGVAGYMPRKDRFVSEGMALLDAVLRLADARQDSAFLRRACRSFYAVTNLKLGADAIMHDPLMRDGDYLRGWRRAALRTGPNPETERFLQESVPKLADRLDAWGFVDGYFAWLDSDGGIRHARGDAYEMERDAWCEFATRMGDKYGARQATLREMLAEFDMLREESLEPTGTIPCHTIHASKGMEFDHVYMIGLAEGELPHWTAVRDGGARMQEERRLCFVGMTRARQNLTLTCSLHAFGRAQQPSRFLREMNAVRDTPRDQERHVQG